LLAIAAVVGYAIHTTTSMLSVKPRMPGSLCRYRLKLPFLFRSLRAKVYDHFRCVHVLPQAQPVFLCIARQDHLTEAVIVRRSQVPIGRSDAISWSDLCREINNMNRLLNLEAFDVLRSKFNFESAFRTFDAKIRRRLARIKHPDLTAIGLISTLDMQTFAGGSGLEGNDVFVSMG